MWGTDASSGESKQSPCRYVYIDTHKELLGRREVKPVRRKAGKTREQALKKPLLIETTPMGQWAEESSGINNKLGKKIKQVAITFRRRPG